MRPAIDSAIARALAASVPGPTPMGRVRDDGRPQARDVDELGDLVEVTHGVVGEAAGAGRRTCEVALVLHRRRAVSTSPAACSRLGR
jgi:hypothetical protein